MITKAGVASNMIVAGVSSYGRSFQMSAAGCYTADCTFTGPLSGALPGPCTDTAGYIADYELDTIISTNPSAESLWDDDFYSNILVYNSNQWVAYVSPPFLGSAHFPKYIQNSNKHVNFFAVAAKLSQ
jgi:chitinase